MKKTISLFLTVLMILGLTVCGSEWREVKAEEMGLTSTDRLEAGGQGLSDEAKILIPYDRDYQGERELIYRGERWKVLRSDPYKDWNGVILLIRRKAGNSV